MKAIDGREYPFWALRFSGNGGRIFTDVSLALLARAMTSGEDLHKIIESELKSSVPNATWDTKKARLVKL